MHISSNMTSISPNPLFQDLRVTFQPPTLVFPSQQTEKKSIFLSHVDQISNFNVKLAEFFPANPEFPPEIVSKRLKMALSKVLVPYDFVAGRLKLNHQSGRREIDCNVAGAGFVMASSEYSLDEIGDLLCPNLGFRQLTVPSLDNLAPDEDHPLFNFQVTSFKCGGFAIGMSANHAIFDGIAYKAFKDNIASQTFDDNRPLEVIPNHNRHLLASRIPPRVAFPHPELFKPDLPTLGPPVYDCEPEELEHKVFKLNSNNINFLREKAKSEIDAKRISNFTLVTTLLWRCKALSSLCNVGDRMSTLLNVVDIRSRLIPPLPKSYCGNALLPAYSMAKCLEIEKGPFGKLVELVSEGPKRLTDEYARSLIDWFEINKGLPYGDYMVSSWLGLRLEQVVYPWGKPIHSGPAVSHRKDICWVFPDAKGTIHAMVSLPAEEMKKFTFHFHKFFASDSDYETD